MPFYIKHINTVSQRKSILKQMRSHLRAHVNVAYSQRAGTSVLMMCALCTSVEQFISSTNQTDKHLVLLLCMSMFFEGLDFLIQSGLSQFTMNLTLPSVLHAIIMHFTE